MKKKILFFILLLVLMPIVKAKALDIRYQAHVQTYGWLSEVGENEVAGTERQSRRMEGLIIKLSDLDYEGSRLG